MIGRILEYDKKIHEGVISGEDGNRYIFNSNDWKNELNPYNNQKVDFLIEEEYAKEVYLVEEEDLDDKNNFLPIISVALSLLGIWFILCIFVSFGTLFVAKHNIKKNPKKYSGNDLTNIALALNIIVLSIYTIYILMIIGGSAVFLVR